jgi:hypothetical protein
MTSCWRPRRHHQASASISESLIRAIIAPALRSIEQRSVCFGSFATEPTSPARHLMSASLRKRRKSCLARKCREGPIGGIYDRAALLIVWLPHDRRFIGAVLFFVLFVFVLFIRVAGRHHAANGREGTLGYPRGSFLGDVSAHVVAPLIRLISAQGNHRGPSHPYHPRSASG